MNSDTAPSNHGFSISRIVAGVSCFLALPVLTILGYNIFPPSGLLAHGPLRVFGWALYFLVVLTAFTIFATRRSSLDRSLVPTVAITAVLVGSLFFSGLYALFIYAFSTDPHALPSPISSNRWFESLVTLSIPIVLAIQSIFLLAVRVIPVRKLKATVVVLAFCTPPISIAIMTVLLLSNGSAARMAG